MHADAGDLEQQCLRTVDQLCGLHGWQLLQRADFARRLLESVRADGGNLQYAAFGVYNQALYAACSGAEGRERWNLGYTELHRLLYDRALRHCPEIVADATQLALEYTCARFATCRDPRAFFAFATQHLLNAARSIRRRERRLPDSLEHAVGESDEPLGHTIADERPGPLDHVLSAEAGRQVTELIARYRRRHPRAHKQLAALLLTRLEDLDDETAARRLEVTTPALRVLRSRARERLRADPELLALARELGLIRGDSDE